jgi:hypothetical protein
LPSSPPRCGALAIGASRGIGRAVALALAASGSHVVALARTRGALEEFDDAIRAPRPDAENPAALVSCDLSDHAAIDRLGGAREPKRRIFLALGARLSISRAIEASRWGLNGRPTPSLTVRARQGETPGFPCSRLRTIRVEPFNGLEGLSVGRLLNG